VRAKTRQLCANEITKTLKAQEEKAATFTKNTIGEYFSSQRTFPMLKQHHDTADNAAPIFSSTWKSNYK
jgi:hypothetical protein